MKTLPIPSVERLNFLTGGGEMGELTRAHDWSKTPLGPPETWPQSLCTTLGLLLHSAFPMLLFWGDELTCFYNDAFRPSLGQTGKHPAVGKPGREVWYEVWDFTGPLIERIMATGEAVWFEDQLVPIHRNGRLEDVYWTFSYSPAYGDEGQIAGMLVTCTETTEKVVGLKGLKESRDELDFAIEAAELGVWDLNPATNTFKGNARLKGWFGLQPGDEIPLPLAFAVIDEADRSRVAAAIQRALEYESGGRYDTEYTIVHPVTGYERRVRAVGRAWFTDEKTAYRFNGTLQDITDRRRAEEALRKREAHFRRLTDAAPAILWMTDPDGYCTYLNAQWYAYTGQTEAEAEGFGWLDATHPDDKADAARIFLDANGRREPFSLQYRLRRHDGAYRWAIDQARPRFGAEGTYEGMIGTVVDVHDQKTAEVALRTSEAKLQSLIAAAPVAIGLFVGRDLIVELPNQAFIAIVGKGPDIAGKPLREVMPELVTENQPFLQILDDVYTSGKMFQSFGAQVKIVQHGVMSYNYYNITYTPLFNEAGDVYAILDIAVDVTSQVLAQQELERQRTYLQNALSIADLGTFAVDLATNTGVFSENVRRWFDLPSTHEPMETILNKVHPDDLATVQQIIGQAMESENRSQHDFVYRVLRPADGGVVYLRSFGKAQYADGNAESITGVLQNVTAQVSARQKLEEAEAALRGAVELAELATWSLDVRKGVVSYSPRFMDWLGFSEDTKDLDAAYDPLPGDYRESVPAAIAAVLQPGSSGFYENEHPIVNRTTGQVRIIHAQAQVTYDSDGNPAFLSGSAQDVTKQRQLQQELERQVAERTQQLQASVRDLERSNQNLQQFAYVASHDLQEPLRKIQQFGDRLKSRHGEHLGDGVEYLNRMQGAATRMSALIQDLLSYSRISTQRNTTAEVPLAGVVGAALHDLELVIAETRARISVGPLPTVLGDASQLGQLFQNLLSNALKFRRPDAPPAVAVTAHRVAAADLPAAVSPARSAVAYHRIDVADNGIGFEQQYAERIFQVFQRLHGRSDYTGTGIGLAICEKVAANHGGAIAATSQPGEGATFSVYLPVPGTN